MPFRRRKRYYDTNTQTSEQRQCKHAIIDNHNITLEKIDSPSVGTTVIACGAILIFGALGVIALTAYFLI